MLQKLKDNLVVIPNIDKAKFLLACSGGIDSMALLFTFKKLNLNFGVAHCNFQLRGKESDLDEELVKNSCNDIPFHLNKIDLKTYKETYNASTQMAARETRYLWFNELANEFSYDYIVTAHHLNDQIETFFLNLARGTGIEGLTGINEFNGKVYRPMLNILREEIELFAKQNNITYREDESNSSLTYKRNKIRHQLIPLLKELNPSFEETMLNNINILEATNSIYKNNVDSVLNSGIIKTKGEDFFVSIAKLLENKNAQQYLFEYLRRFNFNSTQVASIYTIIKDDFISGKIFESSSHKLLIDRDYIIISPPLNETNYTLEIKKEDKIVTNPIKLSFDNVPNENIKINPNKKIAYLDYDKLSYPLKLRKWKQGDYFYPLGMNNKKKLSDFFIDNKLSILEKEATYVLTSNKDEILWVVGQRVSENHKVTSETKNILVITFKE